MPKRLALLALTALACSEQPVGPVDVTAIADELGLAKPDKEELVRLYAFLIADDVVSGATSPKDGGLELSKLSVEMRHPKPLMDFYHADDGLSLAERRIAGTVEEVTRFIVESARRLVESALAAERPAVP